MKYWFALFCLPALLAAAGPAPLISGAVRDQLGEPIAGASITAGNARTLTAPDGTFALPGDARSVRIVCAYCQTLDVPVADDGTVVAIVRRYGALAGQTPSRDDLEALPYARAEDALSLAPFVVLLESRRTLPGPRLSYGGASRFGGLLVDDGIPAYDIAAGVTALRDLPAYGVTDVAVRDARDAYRYGDLAGGGTFFTSTYPEQGRQAALAGGKTAAVNVSASSPGAAYNVSLSGDASENRARAGIFARTESAGAAMSAQAFAARDAVAAEYGANARSGIAAARLHYDRARSANLYVDLIADRAGYDSGSAASPITGQWSDLAIQSGVRSSAPLAGFADAGFRLSTGLYAAPGAGIARVAGSIRQYHASAGIASQSGALAWSAGVGAFAIGYGGGISGERTPLYAQFVLPSVAVTYAASARWSLEAQAGESFRLPTLLEAYARDAPPQSLRIDEYATQSASVHYTDLRRFHVTVTALHRNVAGLDEGPVNAAGIAASWQISPLFSLRAWTLHVDDRSVAQEPVFRFGASPLPATPASAWLTYANPAGLRLDAIWRRDLIDYHPFAHVDAGISGPLTRGLRWFGGITRMQDAPDVHIGIRYSQF